MTRGRAALLAGLALLAFAVASARPGGDAWDAPSLFATSRGVGNDGFGALFDMGPRLGWPTARFALGVEHLPGGEGRALMALSPGPSLFAPGEAAAGRLARWVESGNVLVVAFGDPRLAGVLPESEDRPPDDGAAALSGMGAPADLFVALGLEVYLAPLPAAGDPDRPLPASRGLAPPGAPPTPTAATEPVRRADPTSPLGIRRIARAMYGFGGADATAGAAWLTVNGLPVVLRHPLGRGTVVLVADAGMLTNRALLEDGNAILAGRLLHLARGDAPILFEEWSHGEGSHPSLARLLTRPPAVLVAVQVALAAAALAIRRGTRFGRPRDDLPPSRRDRAEHVEAIALLARRAGHADAVARRLRDAFSARTRAALRRPHAPERDLAEAVASRLGREPEGLRRHVFPESMPTTEVGLLRYARALHALEEDLRRCLTE
ncbi:hypothetical protein L6R50_14550 [Myxococcota bacterium]|nr:hypothetical protein [Myxococcota bacterium]